MEFLSFRDRSAANRRGEQADQTLSSEFDSMLEFDHRFPSIDLRGPIQPTRPSGNGRLRGQVSGRASGRECKTKFIVPASCNKAEFLAPTTSRIGARAIKAQPARPRLPARVHSHLVANSAAPASSGGASVLHSPVGADNKESGERQVAIIMLIWPAITPPPPVGVRKSPALRQPASTGRPRVEVDSEPLESAGR